MARPMDIGVVDTLVIFPSADTKKPYAFVQQSLGNHGGDESESPVKYLFGDVPWLPDGRQPVEYTLSEMDRFGIERGVVDVAVDPVAPRALAEHPDRFIGICTVDPNLGMTAVRQLEAAVRDQGVRAASVGPALCSPPVPIDDRRLYPIYAKCVELDIPVFVTVGIPGPRVPLAAQKVELLDEVCYFFPELRIVMRHGGEPWEDLAVKLMGKWPNLYYSTSAFAPVRYPEGIVHFANRRGSDKIIYAGYFAVGLTWDRIFSEFEKLHLADEVWPKFLRGNALRVLGISDG